MFTHTLQISPLITAPLLCTGVDNNIGSALALYKKKEKTRPPGVFQTGVAPHILDVCNGGYCDAIPTVISGDVNLALFAQTDIRSIQDCSIFVQHVCTGVTQDWHTFQVMEIKKQGKNLI